MYVHLRSIVVDADTETRQEMSDFLTHNGIAVLSMLSSADQLPALLKRPEAPQLVLVNLDPRPAETLALVAPLIRQNPAVSFIAMSQVVDARLLMDAIHAGVREFVPLPVDEDKFRSGIDRIAAMSGAAQRSRLFNILPTAGGCGATTIACNLAVLFGRLGRTALLDLDLERGAVASSLDLRPRYTLADVMEAGDRLDRQFLDNALSIHEPSGLMVLARPDSLEDAARVTSAGIERMLGALGPLFENIVIDSRMTADPVHAAAMRAADVNLVVTQMNVPAVRNAERLVRGMRHMGIEPSRISVIVNRYHKRGRFLENEEVERLIGQKIAWLVPNDYRTAIESVNFGEPAVLRSPRSDLSVSLRGLCDSLQASAANGNGAAHAHAR